MFFFVKALRTVLFPASTATRSPSLYFHYFLLLQQQPCALYTWCVILFPSSARIFLESFFLSLRVLCFALPVALCLYLIFKLHTHSSSSFQLNSPHVFYLKTQKRFKSFSKAFQRRFTPNSTAVAATPLRVHQTRTPELKIFYRFCFVFFFVFFRFFRYFKLKQIGAYVTYRKPIQEDDNNPHDHDIARNITDELVRRFLYQNHQIVCVCP